MTDTEACEELTLVCSDLSFKTVGSSVLRLRLTAVSRAVVM